jgi:hypothetical protein
VRTDEDTVALVRRLAAHYPDTVIAGILNRQGRRTARDHRFEGNRVCSLRWHWNIPCFEPKPTSDDGELLTIKKAAAALGVAPSTIHGGDINLALQGSLGEGTYACAAYQTAILPPAGICC